jgi:hypothetical protein
MPEPEVGVEPEIAAGDGALDHRRQLRRRGSTTCSR